MRFTDIFIKRPVLATVISLLILVLGIRSLGTLPIREYPYTQNAVVNISTAYTGADPQAVAGFLTTPIENSISQANGIDYIQSTSTQSISNISAYLKLNYDANKAVSEITTKVNAVLNQLPQGTQQPVISVETGESIDSMYIGFYSSIIANNQITDYLIRVVQPKLQAVNGVQTAEILGNRQFAMRIWLDPAKLAAYNLTATEVSKALTSNNYISAIGRTDGKMFTVNITADTGITSEDEFKKLIIKSQNGAIIRLGDIANVSLGSVNYDTAVSFNGQQAVYIGIKVAPAANILSVISDVKKVFPEIVANLPEGLYGKIVYDATQYVQSAIHEVIKSLSEAVLIVTLVVFLFLGSIRSVVIPVITIPLSLIGSFFIMLLLGYSVNLLTLLALVLAIGLVVDDAIIVVENVYRHIENGMKPTAAAIQGARELANPIIAISAVLIAVYLPIGFMGGLTGALFTEFAFTLAGAVGISAIIALTLSPMMCAKTLTHTASQNKLVHYIDTQFSKLQDRYEYSLKDSLKFLPVTIIFAIIIIGSIYFLYSSSQSELAPAEDQGIILTQLTASPNASLPQTQAYQREVFNILNKIPEHDRIFQLDGMGGLNMGISGMALKPWDQRKRTAMIIQPELQAQLDQIAGGRVVAFQRPPLPGGGKGLPIQFVIQTTQPFDQLNKISQAIVAKAYASKLFLFVDSDLKLDKAQTSVVLDRDRIAEMGLTLQDIGIALGSAVSQGYVNYFNYAGRAYQVIPQVIANDRENPSQLLNYYIKTRDGISVPLSTVAKLKTTVVPESLNHFQQLNSATISAMTVPGISLGDALNSLRNIAKDILPSSYTIDYSGQSRQFIQEGSALFTTFFFALIIIFLVLAALFESFRDPLIVLISVPMSICGAMIFICLGIGGVSLNIYTEVGLVTLIGLISKHGILIVQFANDLQHQGLAKLAAIQQAAAVRLRPILMTSAAMVLGVLPLLTASGAGAASRFNIGIVIATGISIGTLFTLFVVPAMYLLFAKDHQQNKQSFADEKN